MADNADSEAGSDGNFVSKFMSELLSSPLNLALLGVCGFLLYKIIMGQKKQEPAPPREPELPKLKKQDMTLEQLREFDGKGPDGRILLAANGKVFDVTRGKRFYGPGGPYGLFAGRDASRALATFSMTDDVFRNEYDDLSDLTSMQMESVREWEMQFTEKYDYVGRLLKPGEQPRDYSDTEDEQGEESKDKTDADKKKD
ncbi:membrane-associated progesterone receptor component 1-like [Mercenaria mercenaria]|uniref:membrane-associated progesterone receptor component 1-like n=1 Tax=Mercenaria mercenaria TaxID=6596 RepID=UPI00234E5156|nr:membrane-associated progesterone receptor component 1-like [Mercenaria mercenaria]